MKRSIIMNLGFTALLGLGACSSGTSTDMPDLAGPATVPDVTTDGTNIVQFVLTSMKLPTTRTELSIDVNGDGKVDNQLGNIVGALSAQNFDVQSSVDKSVNEGAVNIIMSAHVTDPTLQTDSTAGIIVYLGDSTAFKTCVLADADAGVTASGTCPAYDGTGMFTVDASNKPTTGWPEFYGTIKSGTYKSNNPVTTTHPVAITLSVPLVGGTPLALKVNGGHVQYTVTGTGTAMKLTGEIHGSIKNADIQSGIIPAVAKLLTDQVTKDPNASTAKMILSIFDQGGCTNADNTVAVAKDGKIDVCEVATNSLIMNVLAADVQIYSDSTVDAMGKVTYGNTYGPQKANKAKDSLSLGIGFTASRATFTEPTP